MLQCPTRETLHTEVCVVVSVYWLVAQGPRMVPCLPLRVVTWPPVNLLQPDAGQRRGHHAVADHGEYLG
jgi:hypothetical protein